MGLLLVSEGLVYLGQEDQNGAFPLISKFEPKLMRNFCFRRKIIESKAYLLITFN